MEATSITPREHDSDATGALRDLANHIEGEVHLDLHDRLLYSTDASLYQVEPLGVVVPRSVEDLSRTVARCGALGLAMLPRAGGTSLAGQCVNRAVVIDVSKHLRTIRDLDTDAGTVVAEAGATVEDVNRFLDAHESGLFFAPDPATLRQACIGGVIGNNAAGARSIRYGRTSENIRSIDAVLSDGASIQFGDDAQPGDVRCDALRGAVRSIVERHRTGILERFPKTIRRNAGYNLDMLLSQIDAAPERPLDLTALLCGSEGTLAFTARARLRLHPKPLARGLAVVAFRSLEEAIDSVAPILETGPTAVELVDDMIISLARRNLEYRRYVDLLPRADGHDPAAVLYVEYSAQSPGDSLEASFAALRHVCAKAPIETHTDAGAMDDAWRLRQAGEPLLHGLPGERKPITFVEDNAVPTEHLCEFVARFKAILREHGTTAAFFAHASVGVLHVRPLIAIRDEQDRRKIEPIAQATAELARSLGGVMSGEHGDGRARTPFLEWYYGREIVDAFGEIKRLFDPANLLNPGNIVTPRPAHTIQTDLRIDAERVGADSLRTIHTHFDYTEQHGLLGAIEACNGSGLCRKRQGGTMCPSYMALGDERHTTRGRANALRLAITGQFGPGDAPSWNDGATSETLDLCLSCKACKAECPTNVDVARLKAEYTSKQHALRGGPPRSARLLSDIRRAERWGSAAPALSNALLRFAPTRRALQAALGFHPKRSLPPFRPPLRRLLRGQRFASIGGPRVALFTDCFTSCGESQIGLAAAQLLDAFGYEVDFIDAGCCGRPALSLGMLERAENQIRETIRAITRHLVTMPDTPLLFLEPSCLSAALDEWTHLKIPEVAIDVRRRIAERCSSVEAFLDTRWEEHPKHPELRAGAAQRIVLHEHCHQKALLGAGASAGLLRRISACDVDVLDAGCCGMAGAWGMAGHRFDLSMRIGERVLFPTLRDSGAGVRTIATGTSCRHQILDGVGAHAQHPVEFVVSLLGCGPE